MSETQAPKHVAIIVIAIQTMQPTNVFEWILTTMRAPAYAFSSAQTVASQQTHRLLFIQKMAPMDTTPLIFRKLKLTLGSPG